MLCIFRSFSDILAIVGGGVRWGDMDPRARNTVYKRRWGSSEASKRRLIELNGMKMTIECCQSPEHATKKSSWRTSPPDEKLPAITQRKQSADNEKSFQLSWVAKVLSNHHTSPSPPLRFSLGDDGASTSQGEKKVADFWPVRKFDKSALLSANN